MELTAILFVVVFPSPVLHPALPAPPASRLGFPSMEQCDEGKDIILQTLSAAGNIAVGYCVDLETTKVYTAEQLRGEAPEL